MDHRLIRQNARYIIKGNLLQIWIPLILLELISLPFSLIIVKVAEAGSDLEKVLTIIFSLLLMPVTIGCYEYFLNIVRGKEPKLKSLFNYFDRFGTILLAIVIIGLLTTIGTFLLIIPGIIIALMYSQIYYVIVDNPEDNAISCLKKSRELINGYKWDYIVFNLKFIGWILLTVFTFGIAGIYVIPYVIIAQTKYYDNLVHLNKN